jgi:pimeloyl-ACP methyl ester carboxylesterase
MVLSHLRNIIFLSFLFALGACNSYKIASNQANRKFKKAEMEHHIVPFGDFQIDYWDNHKADKPVLLLINGFGASTKFQWLHQVGDLSPHFRLVVPNLLYFGKSKPIQQGGYEISDQLNMLETLIQNLDINRFALCGVSYGGLISAEFARLHPEQIEKLILFDTPVKYFKKEHLDEMAATYGVESFMDIFAPDDHHGLKILLELAYQKPPKIPAALLKSPHREMYVPNLEHLKEILNRLPSQIDDYAQKEYLFDFPTLLLWGENDDVIPKEVGEQLNAHMHHSQLKLIPDCKHMPNLEKPKTFNPILLDFLLSEN